MIKFCFGLTFLSVILFSCSKDPVVYVSPDVHDYFPLSVGKYITYQLDSTLFINFGQKDTLVSYQAKDEVTAQTTDNLGRPAYVIVRYLRQDTSQSWMPNNTFLAVPTAHSIEYIQNNLRFLKLEMPVKDGFSWLGNSYIDTYSVYSDVQFMAGWNYTYDSVGVPLTLNSSIIDSTLKVDERDEFLGQDPSIPGTQYGEKTFSVEKYAKGIGLVYRDFIHWEYQGGQTGAPGYYVGYGETLTMLNHN